jgi:hypothetical protein
MVEEQVEETTPGEAAERDYASELLAALGTDTACFDEATLRAAGRQLRVPVMVVVSSSGRVTRAEVSGLLDPARGCVRRRAEAAAFSTPIEGAPRTVRATLQIDVASASATSVDAPRPSDAPPSARNADFAAPGVTLPAQGAPLHPPGLVPPQETLPARVESTHAPGFVPPQHTLPARVP